MSSYKELIERIDVLTKQAEEVRKVEVAAAIAEIKQKMAEYAITPEELGFVSGVRRRGSQRGQSSVKYLDPASGKTWSGRGRRPSWVAAVIERGESLDNYRMQ